MSPLFHFDRAASSSQALAWVADAKKICRDERHLFHLTTLIRRFFFNSYFPIGP